MTAHTPGPWLLVEQGDANEFCILSNNTKDAKWVAGFHLNGEQSIDTQRANAKIMTAAPELLESLVKILRNFKSCIAGGNGEVETDKEDIAKAEAAIKKATT